MSEEVFRVYEALWRRLQREGIYVYYDGMGGLAAGTYYAAEDRSDPKISLGRQRYRSRTEPGRELNTGVRVLDATLLEELITLSHEYGHHLSCEAGNRTPEYVEAMKIVERYLAGEPVPRPSEHLCDLIRAEERRAWRGGRAALTSLGFDRFDRFDERETNDLRQYETIFEWGPLPAHVEVVVEWCSDRHDRGAPMRHFYDARRRFITAIEQRFPDHDERQAFVRARVWPSEHDAIKAVQAHGFGDASDSEVIATIGACLDVYSRAVPTDEGA